MATYILNVVHTFTVADEDLRKEQCVHIKYLCILVLKTHVH